MHISLAMHNTDKSLCPDQGVEQLLGRLVLSHPEPPRTSLCATKALAGTPGYPNTTARASHSLSADLVQSPVNKPHDRPYKEATNLINYAH
jgi:hypothetical protein